jgi:DNA-binding transcriptional ArsR family regulator
MKPDAMDAVFAALASRERRQMLDIVLAHPGCGVHQVAAHFEMSRVGVLKHLRVLEAAGLVLSEKSGRVRHLYFNAVPLQLVHERWSDRYGALFAGRMTAVQQRVEARSERRESSRA